MLSLLRVRNLAIIEQLEVELGPGLNILTGETGAGKSILVLALRLVLGGRAPTGVVRTGESAAEVEALFDLSDDPAARQRLADDGIHSDGEVVVRRVLYATGRSRAYINGSLATIAQLARLAAGLVDISSQHAHHTLVDSRTHLGFLDDFAGLGEQVREVRGGFQRLMRLVESLDDLHRAARHRAEREDLLRFQLSEIDALELSEDAVERWREDAHRLRHADVLVRSAAHAERSLYAADGSVVDQLTDILHALEGAARRDPQLADVLSAVEGARSELEEAARTLGSYARSVEADPAELAVLEERLHAVDRLIRKHGRSLGDVLVRAAAAREELSTLEDLEGELVRTERQHKAVLGEVSEVARQLSAARRKAACDLGAAITGELHSLGMGNAKVEVDVGLLPIEGGPSVDGARLSAHGVDRVEFLIAPNPGEQPRPLREIASGGELSRALLGVKRVLAQRGPVGTYVFDEVDSGVGGAIAEVIGRKLADVARHHQVLCITHLPQVAAYGERHLFVRKVVRDQRTHSEVVALSEAERQAELARMLGGLEVTDTTRKVAEELMDTARAVV